MYTVFSDDEKYKRIERCVLLIWMRHTMRIGKVVQHGDKELQCLAAHLECLCNQRKTEFLQLCC